MTAVLDFVYGRNDRAWDPRTTRWVDHEFSAVALSGVFPVRCPRAKTTLDAILAMWRTDLPRHYMVLARVPQGLGRDHPLEKHFDRLQDKGAGGDWYGCGGGCTERALCHFHSQRHEWKRHNLPNYRTDYPGREQPARVSWAGHVWTAVRFALKANGFRIRQTGLPPLPYLHNW